jgi:PAS domain S-box-containing protein
MRTNPAPSLQSLINRLLLSHQLATSALLIVVMVCASFLNWRYYLDQQEVANTLLAQSVGEYFNSASQVLRALALMPTGEQELDAIQRTYQIFDVLYLLDSDGKLVSLSPQDARIPLGMDMSAQPFYNRNISDIFISDMFVSTRTGNPTIYISLPLSGNRGLVAGELSLNNLEQNLTALSGSQTGKMLVIENNGDLLVSPDYNLARQQENIRQLGIDTRILQGEGHFYYWFDGFWMYASVLAVPKTTWLALIHVPIREMALPFLLPLVIGLLAMALLFTYSVWRERKTIGHRVISPLEQIGREASYIAEGHYDQAWSQFGARPHYLEITSLADSFDRMKQAIISRETSLQASEERYRYAMDATEDGLWDWDVPSGNVNYNPAYSRMLGYEPDQFPKIVQTWSDALHPDDRARVLQLNQDCIENRSPGFETECRIQTKNGDWKWIFSRGKAVSRDENGRALRMIGTHVDITEKMRAEIALHQSRQQYKSLVDDLKEVVFQTDCEGYWLFLNPAWQEVTGYDIPSSMGKLALDYIHPEDRQRNDELFKRLFMRETDQCRHEIRYRHRDGSTRWIEVWARLTLDDQGKPTGTSGTLSDITERKRSEEAIRHFANELEQRVVERTTSLETANKELEAFSYSVSHDLRSPLRGIDGWSMALLEDYSDRLDDQARSYLQRVRKETQRMGHLIDELLSLSRSSLVTMENRWLDFSALAGKVVNRLQRGDPQRQVEWVIQTDLIVWGDVGLLETALTNLFHNAFKFTESVSDARVEFGYELEAGLPVFFVKDNGVGFDMQFAENLFGPFQRMHKASQYPGSGIGLTIVKRIIQRHGGRFWAEGKINQGAAFYFTLDNPK